MSSFKWYRKLRGGYWVYSYFIGWKRKNRVEYGMVYIERLGFPEWSLEDYSIQK